MGLSFTSVQWLASHSSNVTAVYLEEPYQECPDAQKTIIHARSTSEMMTEMMHKYQSMEVTLYKMEAETKQTVERRMPEVQMVLPKKAALRHEMRRAMVPQSCHQL